MTPRGRGLRAERREPDLDEAKALIRKVQQEDANLRRALRSAGPRASMRINVEIEAVGAELAAAHARIAELDRVERPLPITTKLVRRTIDDMNGILDHAPLVTRVAWVRDLFERIDVDSRVEKAVAVWRPRPTRVLTGRIPYTSGSGGRIRTCDIAVNSRLLYH
jgi:hypothetical protein